jgi:hypothetical protein
MPLCYRRNPEPETRLDIADTVISIREAQHATAICLEAWLRHPIASFENRLAAAMDTEKELFDLVFNPDAFDGHHIHKRSEQPRPRPSTEAIVTEAISRITKAQPKRRGRRRGFI